MRKAVCERITSTIAAVLLIVLATVGAMGIDHSMSRATRQENEEGRSAEEVTRAQPLEERREYTPVMKKKSESVRLIRRAPAAANTVWEFGEQRWLADEQRRKDIEEESSVAEGERLRNQMEELRWLAAERLRMQIEEEIKRLELERLIRDIEQQRWLADEQSMRHIEEMRRLEQDRITRDIEQQRWLADEQSRRHLEEIRILEQDRLLREIQEIPRPPGPGSALALTRIEK